MVFIEVVISMLTADTAYTYLLLLHRNARYCLVVYLHLAENVLSNIRERREIL